MRKIGLELPGITDLEELAVALGGAYRDLALEKRLSDHFPTGEYFKISGGGLEFVIYEHLKNEDVGEEFVFYSNNLLSDKTNVIEQAFDMARESGGSATVIE